MKTFGIYSLAAYAVLTNYAHGGTAISLEAEAVKKAATAVVESAEHSWVLFGAKSVALSQLRMLANECSELGWDGDAAAAIDPRAVRIAESFLRALPDDIPLPEFAPEPDGAISLDWIQSRNRMFSLSIGAANRLAFAWLDGSDKGHGVSRFDGQVIPPVILERIRGIINHGNTSIRAA